MIESLVNQGSPAPVLPSPPVSGDFVHVSAGECVCQCCCLGAEQTPSSLCRKAFCHLDLKENCHLLKGGEPFASCEEAGVCRIAARPLVRLGFIAALQGISDQPAGGERDVCRGKCQLGDQGLVLPLRHEI